MRIDLPLCNFRNCKYQFDGNCRDKVEYEQCEFTRIKNRLQIDTSGSDKIDELEKTKDYVRSECDELKRFLRLTDELEEMIKKGATNEQHE